MDLKCDYCKQTFNQDTFNLSVFLYGAVFLVGHKSSYVGFTCPRCLETKLLQEADLSELQLTISPFMGPNGSHLDPLLRHHSSVIYSPTQIEHLASYDIPHWTCPLTQNTKENFHNLLSGHFQEMPQLEQECLSSYIWGGSPPMGTMASIWWFRPEDIESLLQIENKNQVRVFPRYFHKMSWYEKYDGFCWSYKLYQEYLAGLKDAAADNLNVLRQYAYQKDINLDRLLESDPGITTEAIAESLLQQAQKYADNDIQAASEFLDLLVNFDPSPWDVPGRMSDFYKSLWKSPNPFKGVSVPTGIEDFGQPKYKSRLSDTEVDALSEKARSYILKTHVQEWAVEHHQDFIKDYIAIASRTDFSYGLVWDLKCRYLQQLHDILDKETVQQSRYAFFNDGQTWTIIFDGKPITGLRGKGFRYIQFLVQNQGRQYHTNKLNEINFEPENTSENNDDHKDELEIKTGTDGHRRTDTTAKSQYKAQIRELKERMSEAKKNEDIGTYEKAYEEYEKILSHYEKDFSPSGKPRNFRDDSDKIKDRIVQAIRRAVLNIEKDDSEIAGHFQKALQPINSFEQCYNPYESMDWQFKG